MIPVFIIVQWANIGAYARFPWLLGKSAFWTQAISSQNEILLLCQVKWTTLTQAIGCFSQLLRYAPFLTSLYILKKLFANYGRRNFFTNENTIFYREIALLAILDAGLIAPLSNMLLMVTACFASSGETLTLSQLLNIANQGFLAGFDLCNSQPLLIGVYLLAISKIMEIGLKTQEEQEPVI
jgi:hypothetical protein